MVNAASSDIARGDDAAGLWCANWVVPLGVYGCTPNPVPLIPSESTRTVAEKVCAVGSRFVTPYASRACRPERGR